MLDHPDRLQRLQGASNLRDLGGYRTADGATLRWRRLFRSDHLAGLTEADRAQLQALGIRRTLDFRGSAERAAAGYALPGVAQHALTIEPQVAQGLQAMESAGRTPSADDATRLMEALYRSFVDEHAHRFAEFFEHLLDADGPVLFHCTAGKDRTGWAAALLLLALGVPRETVEHDYLLTRQVFRPPATAGDDPARAAVAAVVWSVELHFLHAGFDEIAARHGGLDRYLQQRLGLSPTRRARLAERYLEGG